MDSKVKSRNYIPHVIKQKRIHHYYQKGVGWNAFLPMIILLLSCLTAASIYNVIGLKTELETLKRELRSYRNRAGSSESLPLVRSEQSKEDSGDFPIISEETEETIKTSNDYKQDKNNLFMKSRAQRSTSKATGQVFTSFLQLIADRRRKVEDEDDSSIIPWLLSFKQGTSMEERKNIILIKEDGFFFIYGQVWYTDELFAMGHVIQRKKVHKVGDDPIVITLFRCVQNMPEHLPNNSCFTGGIAKLEEGDELQLIIPRSAAKIFVSGDGTFFGAIRLL
ncbi:tumor necrosis factor ligand superfamily member 13B [Pelodytes ibericus]